jgi:hypothetical protein
MKMKTYQLILTVALVASSCSAKLNSNSSLEARNPQIRPPSSASEKVYVQVERLGRPAVNEGLVLSNASLNLWNSLPPSADGTSETSGIVGEVVAVQTALINLGAGAPPVGTVAAMFLPDVLRIDVSKTVAPGATAYNSCQGAAGKPLCGGRKLTDDVADITLSFLGASDASGMAVKDNVAYADAHKPLLASFPYLASPN